MKTSIVLGAVALVAATTFVAQRSTVKTHVQKKSPQAVIHVADVVVVTEPSAPPAVDPPPTNKPRRAPVVQEKHVATKPLGLHRLEDQRFAFTASSEEVFTTLAGNTIHVPADAFVTRSGAAVKGGVELHVKEAVKPIDFVMGNLCTVYNGTALESGGTFYVGASAHGEELELAAGKSIDMIVPSRAVKAGMKLFPGEEINGAVVWNDPQPLALNAPQNEQMKVMRVLFDAPMEEVDTARTNVTYSVEGFDKPLDAPQEVTDKVTEAAWANGGLWLKRDSSFQVGKHKVTFYANAEVTVSNIVPQWKLQAVAEAGFVAEQPQGPWNPHLTDTKLNYLFSVKRLGWANIDRLMSDKRTQPVDLVTRIDNAEGMKHVNITLVMKSQGLYIPGYERADGSYGFSHGDYERMRLPIGAKAVVIATADANDAVAFAAQEIVIDKKGKIDLHLERTSEHELKEMIAGVL